MVAHGLERDEVLRALRDRFQPATVLYPGCLLHVTPSCWFQHVVYVDRHPLAARFFADTEGVRRIVNGRKRYRQPAYVRFIEQDFTRGPLPLRPASFDLLLALYAPDVSRTCVDYLRPGGLLLSNDHHGDAEDAAGDPRLALVERRGDYHLFRRRRPDQQLRPN